MLPEISDYSSYFDLAKIQIWRFFEVYGNNQISLQVKWCWADGDIPLKLCSRKRYPDIWGSLSSKAILSKNQYFPYCRKPWKSIWRNEREYMGNPPKKSRSIRQMAFRTHLPSTKCASITSKRQQARLDLRNRNQQQE